MKVSILKQKNFSLLMFARLISIIGTQMQDFALSLYVLKVTGSATKFASVIAIALIPQLILSPFAGVFADWFDRKKIIILLDLLSGIIVGLFAFIFFIQGSLSLPFIYVLVIALSLVSSMYQPAISTIIPSIIKKDDLVDANGLNQMILNLGCLAAPLIAGILFGIMGLFLILVLNSVSFLIASFSEIFINIPKTNKMPEKISIKAFTSDFMEGFKFIINHKLILTVLILAAFINFLFSPFNVALTYVSKQILKVTDTQYGITESFLMASSIVAPLFSSYFAKKYKLGVLFFRGILFSSIAIIIMAIIPSPIFLSLFKSNIVPLICLIFLGFMVGLFTMICNIAMSVMLQQTVPLNVFGRVVTVLTTCCMICMPLGTAVFGMLYDRISAWICLLITGTASVIVTLAFRKALTTDDTVIVDKTGISTDSGAEDNATA